MIFHRVLQTPDPLLPYEFSQVRFERHVRNVQRWFNILPLEEAVERLSSETLPPRALSITFDDGYADNHQVALPILRRLGVQATFFIATGFLDGGCMWNDQLVETIRSFNGRSLDLRAIGLGRMPTASVEQRRAAIELLIGELKYRPSSDRLDLTKRINGLAQVPISSQLMMTSQQVRSLSDAGMGIGAHTHSHPILAALDLRAARVEIEKSKEILQHIVRKPIRLFAYPNGRPLKDYTRAHVEQVRSLGFLAACATSTGVANSDADLMQLPRFTPWDNGGWQFGMRLSLNLRRLKYETA